MITKLVYIPIIVLLSGCALTQPALSPSEKNAVENISFINTKSLPENLHINIIGVAKGKYETTYGNSSQMISELKISAVKAGGDGLLPYNSSSQYISMTDTTVITGLSSIVRYIKPIKEQVLLDYSKGTSGGLVAISASRFAQQYVESRAISKRIINEAKLCKCSGSYILPYAFNSLIAQKDGSDIEFIMNFIKSEMDNDAVIAIKYIAEHLSNNDTSALNRLMKYHLNSGVKLEAAKLLIGFGLRSKVEEYSSTLKEPLRAQFSMILI